MMKYRQRAVVIVCKSITLEDVKALLPVCGQHIEAGVCMQTVKNSQTNLDAHICT